MGTDESRLEHGLPGELKRLWKSIDRDGIEDLLKYLEEQTDFFESPASTKYHGSYRGGLAEHSLNVFHALEFLYDNLMDSDIQFPQIPRESRIIAALGHDLCKANTYQEDRRWTKDEDNKWIQVPFYKKDPILPMGHGGKSVYLLSKFIEITDEEAMAIFWHMGAYDTSGYMTLNELGKAYEINLLAFLLHQADMLSTYIIENERYSTQN